MTTAKLAYTIDLGFLLLAPLHPALIMLAVVQYIVRRSAWLCAGLLVLFGQHEVTPLALIVLPGAAVYLEEDESYVARGAGSEPAPTGSSTGSAQVVPSHQNQPEPAPPLDFDDMIDYLTQHNLTDEQTIDVLTLMRRESGDLLSANKIRDIVGGNEAAVKARVAAWRPKAEPQRSQGRVPRPHGGW